MQEDHTHNFGLRLSEVILILSGVLLLVNAVFVVTGGSFVFWTTAKIVYVIGVLLLFTVG